MVRLTKRYFAKSKIAALRVPKRYVGFMTGSQNYSRWISTQEVVRVIAIAADRFDDGEVDYTRRMGRSLG